MEGWEQEIICLWGHFSEILCSCEGGRFHRSQRAETSPWGQRGGGGASKESRLPMHRGDLRARVPLRVETSLWSILDSAIFLYLHINTNYSFDLLGFSTQAVISLETLQCTSLSSFLILFFFFISSCCLSVTLTSNLLLKWSSGKGHPCFVADPKVTASNSFNIKYDVCLEFLFSSEGSLLYL